MLPAPEAMNITPSTTIGVACIVAGDLPSSRWTDQAPPSLDRFDFVIRVSDEYRWLARFPPMVEKLRPEGDCPSSRPARAAVDNTRARTDVRRSRGRSWGAVLHGDTWQADATTARPH